MINWKITRVSAEGDVIIDCHYMAWAIQEIGRVETEGNWTFSDKTVEKPFSEVTEKDIIAKLIKESSQDGVSIIESRLIEQLQSINKGQHLPWLPAVFTPKI